MGSSGLCSRCVLSYEQHINTLHASIFPRNVSFSHHPHPFPMPFLLSEHVFLHGQAHAVYSGQHSCLPCIMCPLRGPSGRWKPTRALGLHRGAHHYGKVCEHMALNRDVQRFSLNVPPTCRISLKCNEVLVREGRWLRRSDSHYCLVIDCQAADATLRNISSMSKECHEI